MWEHQDQRYSEVSFDILVSFLTGLIPYKRDTLFHEPGEWLTAAWEICDEPYDIGQSTLQASKLFEILRWMRVLDSFDFIWVKMDPFWRDNES